MTKLWTGGALVLLLITAGAPPPVEAHTCGGCAHTHSGGTTICDQHGAACTLASGAAGVCRQRTRNCICEARRDGEPTATEADATGGGEAGEPVTEPAGESGTEPAAEPIRLFAEILFTPAPCTAERDAQSEGLGLTLASRAQQCSITCFSHNCSIQCNDGQQATCKCVNKQTPTGWQWIPTCYCW